MIAGDDFVSLLRQLGEPYRTMVSLIAAAGLRIGELLALRWPALDLDAGTLTVRESVFEGTFQPPKTQRAQRTIPLGPRAVKVLLDHRQRQVRREPNDLVFGNRNGSPSANRNCSRAFCNRRPSKRGSARGISSAIFTHH